MWILRFKTLNAGLMNLRLAFEFQNLMFFLSFQFWKTSSEPRVSIIWTRVSCVETCIWVLILGVFHCFKVLTFVFFFFVVRYFVDPLSKMHHFGHIDGLDPNVLFRLWRMASAFTGKNQEWQAQLTRDSVLTLREILSDRKLKSEDRRLLRKPEFFFGDSIERDDENLYNRDYKWLCQIGN